MVSTLLLSGYDPATVSCEHGNELLAATEG
jgi:hypothetical protein